MENELFQKIKDTVDALPVVDEYFSLDGAGFGVLSRNSQTDPVTTTGYYILKGDPFDLGDDVTVNFADGTYWYDACCDAGETYGEKTLLS